MDSSQSPSDGGNGMPPISQTNDTAASMQNLKQISESIEKTLALIDQLTLTVSTCDGAMQMPLLQRIDGLVLELDNMIKLAENCNIQVPMEVVKLIDDGKTPDLFTRDVINDLIAKNQITKGKTDVFQNFRNDLIEELEKDFPHVVETFRESRAASAASTSAASSSAASASGSTSAELTSASAVPASTSASAVPASTSASTAPASAVSASASAAPASAASASAAPASAASASAAPASASAAGTNMDMIKDDSALGLEEDGSVEIHGPDVSPSLDPEREVRSERKKRKPTYLEDYVD